MGAVSFGYGLFHLAVSLLPNKLLNVVHLLGFEGDRQTGIQALLFARQGSDMRAPIATYGFFFLQIYDPFNVGVVSVWRFYGSIRLCGLSSAWTGPISSRAQLPLNGSLTLRSRISRIRRFFSSFKDAWIDSRYGRRTSCTRDDVDLKIKDEEEGQLSDLRSHRGLSDRVSSSPKHLTIYIKKKETESSCLVRPLRLIANGKPGLGFPGKKKSFFLLLLRTFGIQ